MQFKKSIYGLQYYVYNMLNSSDYGKNRETEVLYEKRSRFSEII